MSFALYRLPYADTYTEIRRQGEPLVLQTLEDLQDKEGFVIAPFSITKETPLLLIPSVGSSITEKNIEKPKSPIERKNVDIKPISESYRQDFGKFHTAIEDGKFAKLVLARTSEQDKDDIDLNDLFLSTCNEYPRAMVMMFSNFFHFI